MILRIIDDAKAELRDAIRYHNRERKGLGHELRTEVYATFDRILDRPLAAPLIGERTRRTIMNRFRYSIFYRVHIDEILVVAIIHHHRRPDIWRNRTGEPD